VLSEGHYCKCRALGDGLGEAQGIMYYKLFFCGEGKHSCQHASSQECMRQSLGKVKLPVVGDFVRMVLAFLNKKGVLEPSLGLDDLVF
jgi:hypothetical protein